MEITLPDGSKKVLLKAKTSPSEAIEAERSERAQRSAEERATIEAERSERAQRSAEERATIEAERDAIRQRREEL